MKTYLNRSTEELKELKSGLMKQYTAFKEADISLDITRGKPSSRQLDLSEGLLTSVSKNEECFSESKTDCRNYGLNKGIPEARKLMGDLMGAPWENVIIYGNASLAIMFDMVSKAFTHGICGSTPWSKLDEVKFLCPVPGYDRHFAVTEYFGVKMINVPMLDSGPAMDIVEEIVSNDEAVKGIWCVPMYSNPQGISYSDDTVKRFASLKSAASDFRIYWDNAYGLHHLYDEEYKQDRILNIIEECEKAGNPDLPYVFASTSKITYAGAGIAAIASSKANIDDISLRLNYQTIGYDKMNQLRHVRYFKNAAAVKEHMKKHAALMRVNFETVYKALEEGLDGLGIAKWTRPRGGYFICFEALPGCASEIVRLAKEAGLSLTAAGSVFPLHKDPRDSLLRIAPTVPTPDELREAFKIFVVCVKLASIDKLLADRK